MCTLRYLTAIVVGSGLMLPHFGCGSQESGASRTAANISGGTANASGEDPQPDTVDTPSPGPPSNPLRPTAIIETSFGNITVLLDGENAPGTVRNFVNYVNSGHYHGTIFHYVEPGSMILGGGFSEDLAAIPTAAPIRNEAHNGLKNKRGTIAMARLYESIDSATSQFFINLKENTQLDFRDRTAEEYGYCVFGEVLDGLDVAEQISQAPTRDQGDFVSAPVEPVAIVSIRIVL